MEEHSEYKSFRTEWCRVVNCFGLMICVLFLVVLCKMLQDLGKMFCTLKEKYSSSQNSQYLLNMVNKHHTDG